MVEAQASFLKDTIVNRDKTEQRSESLIAKWTLISLLMIYYCPTSLDHVRFRLHRLVDGEWFVFGSEELLVIVLVGSVI